MKKSITAILCIGLLPIVSIQALQWDTENFVDSDTLLLYRFNETSGTTIFDSSGNGFNGTLGSETYRAGSAPTWLTTPSGDFLAPTGNAMTSNVTVTGANFNTGLTVSFWLQDNGLSGTLFGLGVNNLRISNSGSNLYLRTNTNANTFNFGGQGTWRHIGVVYDPLNGNAADGGEWRVYLNNTLVSTHAESTDLGSLSSFLVRVGNNVGNSSTLSNAYIDEFLISNRIITDFSAAAIPEPGTLALLVISGLSILLTYRRKRRQG